MTNRNKAIATLETIRDKGISDTQILEYLINNYLSGDLALQAVDSVVTEFDLEDEPDEEEEESGPVCGACGGDATICDGC